ncbi:MAG: 50S ribosomal protein L29 [Nanoarchaeota archaeon]|nr:50S ribosomal protein L29 [Nanoarchaeota archaeon]
MAILKSNQIKAMPEKEMEKKMQELRLELMKEIKPGQGASIKTKEIKRTIARLLTARRSITNNTQIKSNK